jgi:hypothetical protein
MTDSYSGRIRNIGKWGYQVTVSHAGKKSVYVAPNRKIARDILQGKSHPKKYHVVTTKA